MGTENIRLLSEKLADQLGIDSQFANSRHRIFNQLYEAHNQGRLTPTQAISRDLPHVLKFMYVSRDPITQDVQSIQSATLKFDGTIRVKRHAGSDTGTNQMAGERDLVISFLGARGFIEDKIIFKALDKEYLRRLKLAERMFELTQRGLSSIKNNEFSELENKLRDRMAPLNFSKLSARVD